MSSLDRLSGVSTFVHAAEAGSFAGAAQRLGLTRSAVAKAIARLEQRLAVRLFHRTTRSLSLTAEGRLFHHRCLRVIAELDVAEEEVSQQRTAVAGPLRVTMPVHLGLAHVAPLLFGLASRHPRLALHLSFSDQVVHLVEDGFDLAIRSGPLPGTLNLKARPLGAERMVLCAAPAYLAHRGEPATVAALASHQGLFHGSDPRAGWRLPSAEGAGWESVAPQARCLLDDLAALAAAAEAGLGIAWLPGWLARPALQAGRLRQVLPGLPPASIPLHLVWPASRHVTRKLRVAIDELVDHLPRRLEGTEGPVGAAPRQAG